MKKFKDKYRSASTRMPQWDYSNNGKYFITLVVNQRDCLFGYIENKKMQLNDWGRIAYKEWYKSFEIRDELFCDVFVIMPNHLHAIVTIYNSENKDEINDTVASHGRVASYGQVASHGRVASSGQVASHGRVKQQLNPRLLYRKPKSLSSFIAGYKSAVTTQINNYIDVKQSNSQLKNKEKYTRNNRLWQRNYYDHIIRSNESYEKIKWYIKHNPSNWDEDKFKS